MLLTSSSGCIGNAMTDDLRIVSAFPLLAQPSAKKATPASWPTEPGRGA
jgi:hypothetical protein